MYRRNNEFLKPTLEEYKIMLKLKKAGFEKVYVTISGSGDSGTYDDIEHVPYSKESSGFREELKVLEKYLERCLDNREDFSFDGDGCNGVISIHFKGEDITMTFETEIPVWTNDVSVKEVITPNTLLEELAAKSEEEEM